MKTLKVVVLMLAFALPLCAQEGASNTKSGGAKKPDDNCGLLYGKGHSLTFCAPNGWVLDNGTLNDQGIYAVFYPAGSSWEAAKDSGTIMYINVVARPEGSSTASMMDADAREAKQNAPGTIVKQGTVIQVEDHSVPVLQFAPGAFDRYETVAYVMEEKVLVMFVVSSKNKELFQKDYPFFEKLVQSYKFLSSNVTIKHK